MTKRRGRGEGGIYQRADGRWEAQLDVGWENGRRKRRSFYGRTRREVLERLSQAQRKLAEHAPLPSERLTVGQLVERWIEDVQRPTAEPSTYARERGIARQHILPALGRRPLVKLTQPEVQAWVARMSEDFAPATVRLHHSVLHNALETAVQWRLLAYNPADRIKLPKMVRRRVPVLDQEPARRFLEAARGDALEAVYIVALTTALRIGEILGLRWEDVDLDQRTIDVNWKLLHLGKGIVEGAPKTQAGQRRVELHAMAVAALRVHRVRQAEKRLLLGTAWQRADLVFTTDTGKPLRANNITSYRLPKVLSRAGLTKLTFHQLRHSVATLMLSRGEDIVVVQKMLGHSSPMITWGMYRHVLPGEQRAAVDRLGALLFEAREDATSAREESRS
jgi:integrase